MIIHAYKTPRYLLQPLDGGNSFQYLTGVTTQRIDPLPMDKLSILERVVLHSTLKRVSNGLIRGEGQLFVPSQLLDEIKFNISMLCTEDEWQNAKSVIVRQRFKEFFIADKLPVSRSDIFSEISSVLDYVRAYEMPEMAIVSHSFRMKLLEAYIQTQGKIVLEPKLIHNFIHDERKTYEFGERVSFVI